MDGNVDGYVLNIEKILTSEDPVAEGPWALLLLVYPGNLYSPEYLVYLVYLVYPEDPEAHLVQLNSHHLRCYKSIQYHQNKYEPVGDNPKFKLILVPCNIEAFALLLFTFMVNDILFKGKKYFFEWIH